MADHATSPLDGRGRRALHVLGHLFLRMGRFVQARKLFAALLALDGGDRQARASLAAACLSLGEGAEALKHADLAIGAGPLSTRDAALHLIRARALSLCGRGAEAAAAVEAWLAAGGRRP